MNIDIPRDVRENLDNCERLLEECRELILEGDGVSHLREMKDESTHALAAGRSCHSLAMLIMAMCNTLVQCHGMDPQRHAFLKKEKDRLAVYLKKIDKADAKHAALEKKRKNTLVMNIETANKFISAALEKKSHTLSETQVQDVQTQEKGGRQGKRKKERH